MLAVALAEWTDAVSGLTDSQIDQGIRAMRDQYPEWPPTTGEFRALCRPVDDDLPEHRMRPLYQRALPEPESVTQARDAYSQARIDELRAAGLLLPRRTGGGA